MQHFHAFDPVRLNQRAATIGIGPDGKFITHRDAVGFYGYTVSTNATNVDTACTKSRSGCLNIQPGLLFEKAFQVFDHSLFNVLEIDNGDVGRHFGQRPGRLASHDHQRIEFQPVGGCFRALRFILLRRPGQGKAQKTTCHNKANKICFSFIQDSLPLEF
jgi:hypothetical protein